MPQKSTFTCSLVDVRTIKGFDSIILSLKEFAYGAITGLCISYSSKGLQQEPRKIYSQLAMPGNICNLYIQFTRSLLPCLHPPSASKLEMLLTFLLLWRHETRVKFSPWNRKCCLLKPAVWASPPLADVTQPQQTHQPLKVVNIW